MDDDLLNYLDTLSRGDCYRVDALLKDSPHELTERVFLIAADGSERGPFIRKRIALESGLGDAYERLWKAQRAGRRFVHLPRIIECDVEDGWRSVVMEHIEGTTLEEAVPTSGHDEISAASVAMLLCDAVMELHEGFDPSLIHRDLKPSNVIVSSSNLTLIDFGIARTFDEEATADTRSFGTRGYAPPEQFGYGQTDERSDVYALGLLIAYCFLGEEAGRSLVESGFDDERIPPAIRSALVKATAFDPSARCSSVRELRESLSAKLHGESSAAASASRSEERPNPPREDARLGEDQRTARDRTSAKKGPLARVPRWVGSVWNALLIGFWALLLVAGVVIAFSPEALVVNGRDCSPPAQAIFSIGLLVICPSLTLYPLLDTRRLRERVKLLPHGPWVRLLAICWAIAFAVAIVSVVLGTMVDDAILGAL